MAMFPSSTIRMNQIILAGNDRSRQATRQKNVMKPKYASWSVAQAHELPLNDQA
jgi:hypothetical protein